MIRGQKLREFRERRKVTATSVAKKIGISRNAIADMETRRVGNEAAQDYLNAVHEIAHGTPGFIRVQTVVFAPGGVVSPDEQIELPS